MADPTPILELIEAFRRSKTMFTAVSFGLFDRLEAGGGTAAELAAALQLDEHALVRLLDGCVGLGLVTRVGAQYFNTETASAFLRRESPDTLTGYILYSDKVLFPLWNQLDVAVKEGSNRWQAVFGGQGAIFDHFFRTAEARRDFLLGMHGLGRLSSPEIVKVFNLNRFRHLVDLGGGTGHLAIAACERYGNLRGVVFDLPVVVEHARAHIADSRAAGRLGVEAGDFFADPLPPADLYAVGRVLHDWKEDKIRALLAKINAALPVGGAVLVAECVLDEDGRGPVAAQMQSLNMLVCTEGRERTESEYRALLEGAGFTNVECRRTGAPLDAVLAFRKE
ncbi:MAG TPA: methyltransferase [Paludibaculum sp.]